MNYLIRLAQFHQDFRLAEVKALAELERVQLEVIEYKHDSPYCIVRLESAAAARRLVSRSILAYAIYELWAVSDSYDELHAAIKSGTAHLWPLYKQCSFKFDVNLFQGSRNSQERVSIIESFRYLGFEGKIQMKNPEQEFCVFEEYEQGAREPGRLFFGRLLARGARDDVTRYSLKKRRYLSTTSMDAELALVGSNLTLARPGSLFYDPFLGTASLTIACSHHGAVTLGSDLDGRQVRGQRDSNVLTNYGQYGLAGRYLDGFVGDLTHSPLRLGSFVEHRPIFDGIVCDPPYGVREGLRVLGSPDGNRDVKYTSDGRPSYLADDYIPTKRPYGFEALLADILDFAALALVVNGRLSFWMPTANEQEVQIAVPSHPALELISVCVQPFNKWSRRLITYRRRRDDEIEGPIEPRQATRIIGKADELNNFRKRYFEGFRGNQEETATAAAAAAATARKHEQG